MSFIQCKDRAEVERVSQDKKHCFVTEDFRVYDSIEYADDAMFHQLDPEEIDALLRLRDELAMVSDPMHEMAFQDVVACAEGLQEAFKKASELVKYKIEKKKNG